MGQKKVESDVIQSIHSVSLEPKRTSGCSIDTSIADCWVEVTARSYASAGVRHGVEIASRVFTFCFTQKL